MSGITAAQWWYLLLLFVITFSGGALGTWIAMRSYFRGFRRQMENDRRGQR